VNILKKGGAKKMECTHPAIIDGKCLVCKAVVDGAEGANSAPKVQDGQTDGAAVETPEKAQETPKKTTRKRKTTNV
jgi:hypothetical protein